MTGRDVDMQDLIISFNKNSCKWEYVSSAEENEQEREYETYQKDMLVMMIRDLVSETGIWQGPVSEILKAGFFQEDERAIGKQLSVIEPLLMKYDGISHTYRRTNGKRLHTFRIDILF